MILLPIRSTGHAHEALGRVRKGEVDGIFATDFYFDINTAALKASRRDKIPVMVGDELFMERGGFACYCPSVLQGGRQLARLIDKVIRGEKPADIPVEVNNKVELIVNLKVARQLGIEIPKQMLYRAERIIR